LLEQRPSSVELQVRVIWVLYERALRNALKVCPSCRSEQLSRQVNILRARLRVYCSGLIHAVPTPSRLTWTARDRVQVLPDWSASSVAASAVYIDDFDGRKASLHASPSGRVGSGFDINLYFCFTGNVELMQAGQHACVA
jgi:hypothetical protein